MQCYNCKLRARTRLSVFFVYRLKYLLGNVFTMYTKEQMPPKKVEAFGIKHKSFQTLGYQKIKTQTITSQS